MFVILLIDGLEHLQQPSNTPRAKNYFALRPSPGLARRAALAPAAAVKYSARKNAARASNRRMPYVAFWTQNEFQTSQNKDMA